MKIIEYTQCVFMKSEFHYCGGNCCSGKVFYEMIKNGSMQKPSKKVVHFINKAGSENKTINAMKVYIARGNNHNKNQIVVH